MNDGHPTEGGKYNNTDTQFSRESVLMNTQPKGKGDYEHLAERGKKRTLTRLRGKNSEGATSEGKVMRTPI